MGANSNLHKAKEAKNDEFYTEYTFEEMQVDHIVPWSVWKNS